MTARRQSACDKPPVGAGEDTRRPGAGFGRETGLATRLDTAALGDGSDLAGRATAAAMEAANEDLNINVENVDGGSGAVGYAQFMGESGNGQYLLATETDLDVAIISTPDFWHAPHTNACLRAGLHGLLQWLGGVASERQLDDRFFLVDPADH